MPLSLKYLQAALIESGFETIVLTQKDKTAEEFIQEIHSYSPTVVGATATTCELPLTAQIMKALKEKNKQVATIVGGYHVSAFPESIDPKQCPSDTNPSGIDFLMLGECEKSFAEFVKSVESGKIDHHINGLAFLEEGKVKVNLPLERITNLDSVPSPKWDEEELKDNDFDGMISRKNGKNGFTAAIVSERGCPFGCSFCSTQTVYGRQVQKRSISNLASEIESLVKNQNVDMIVDYAPTGNLDSNRIHEFCEEIRKKGLEKTFSMYALWRLESPYGQMMVHDSAVEDLTKTVWCFKAGFGIEALAPNDAKFLGKTHSLENLFHASEIFDQNGALLRGFYMITPETDWNSIQNCASSKSVALFDDLRVTYSTPFPGTLLYEQNKANLITQNWGEFNCEQPVLKSKVLTSEQLMRAKNEILQGFLLNPYRKQRIRQKTAQYPSLANAFEEYETKMKNFGFKT
ncbi:MAG: cobalamin-dependent protein [Candidatus Diapherotrites archaeon]